MFVSILCPHLLSTLTSHTLLVILCDEGNRQAENGVDTAIKYLTGKGLGSINRRSMVTLTGEPFKAAGDSEYQILVVCPDLTNPRHCSL